MELSWEIFPCHSCPALHQPGVAVHNCNPNAWKMEIGRPEVQDRFCLCRELKPSLRYIISTPTPQKISQMKSNGQMSICNVRKY